jgi:protein involved in polysaccharide export with SLBB domain
MMNNTDGDYGLVVRRGKLQRNTEIYQFSPIEVLKGNEDLDLQALDEIMLFERVSVVQEDYESSLEDEQNLELKQEESELLQEQVTMRFTRQELSIDKDGDFSRQTLLEPLIARLKSEASESNQVKLVEITGQVRYPGTYPLSNKQTVRDMLVAAGGLIESAHLDTAQITSLQITNGESNIEHNTINLMDEISGVSTTQLRSKDVLNVLRVPDWYQNNTVELAGEIVFPGKYQIKKGETLSELIERAGGLTDKATADAAVFTRLELKEKEKQNIQKAVEDLKQQLANSNLSSNQFSKTVDYQNAKEILDELTDIEPIGRLIIDLSAVISKTNSLPIELKDGDKLIVPNITPAISIIGEVFVPSTHAYRPESTIEDYLAKAGGVKEYGDSSKMYIVRANGSVYVPQKNYWFSSNEVQALQPGDTIILPREVNDYSNIGLWQGVTQIIYQTAIALSAINSF